MTEQPAQPRDIRGRFDPDPARSYSLASWLYTDAEIFAAEKQAIFYRSWQLAGHTEQVRGPGDYTVCQIGDESIIVIRGDDGVLRAFYNVCQHRAHELLEGSGRTSVIVCPYHAWSYHIDGRLRTARGSDKVARFDAGEFCLKPVRVEEFCTFVFVNLDADAAPLAHEAVGLAGEIHEYAPDLDSLTHAHRLTYEVKANWKTIIDNFLECFHCPVAHRAFADLVDMASYRVVTHEIWSSHHASAGTRENAAYDVSGADVTHQAVWWLWPNTCFLCFPGSSNIMAWRMSPAGPERTLETFDFYFLERTPDAQQREAIEYIDTVLQPEDIAIVESVQRGMHSRGYSAGRFMVNPEGDGHSEHGVHHFHSLVIDALERDGPGKARG